VPRGRTPVAERVALVKLLEVYERRFSEMAKVISMEMGAPIDLARQSQMSAGSWDIPNTIAALEVFAIATEHRLHDADGNDVVQGVSTVAFVERIVVHHSQVARIADSMGFDLVRDLPRLSQLYVDGDLHLDQLITATYSLDQINEAIASTRSGQARRNVIIIGHPVGNDQASA
jgi:hypothetical protein